MAAIPENAQRTVASFPALVWLGCWGFLAVMSALLGNFVLFGVFLVAAIIGWIPAHEGPLFLFSYRKLRLKWKMWRLGTAYRRSIDSTQMVLQRGVSALKGLFKAEIVLLEFKSPAKEVYAQMPALINGRRHTIMVETGSNPAAALADDEDREDMRDHEANFYQDIAEVLGEGNAYTVWSLHREEDTSADTVYLEERLEESIRDQKTPAAAVTLQKHHASVEEVTEDNWERRFGISLTATNPSSWRANKLDKLTADELQESPAVQAALVAEDKMEGIGLADSAICTAATFKRLIREIFSVKDLELFRDKVIRDVISEKIAAANDEFVDPATMFSADETPLPTMQRELGNDYMIFDGTYHRVMWITNYLSHGSYDALHTAKCNYFVSVYCDIWSAQQDDSRRQDKGRLFGQILELTKRNVTARDEEELQKLEDERYDSLRFGRYVVYFRTLVIVSGKSLEDMEESQKTLTSHLARENVRVQLKTITGGDQLEWFFAALGSFGASK